MPYIKKAKVKELVEDWIAEFAAAANGKVRPIRGKVTEERLYTIVWWRSAQLLEFYEIGLIDFVDIWEYVDLWKTHVEEGSPCFELLNATLKKASEPLVRALEPSEPVLLESLI